MTECELRELRLEITRRLGDYGACEAKRDGEVVCYLNHGHFGLHEGVRPGVTGLVVVDWSDE